MEIRKVVAAILFAVVLASGCSSGGDPGSGGGPGNGGDAGSGDSGGSSGETPAADIVLLEGTVLDNHTDVGVADRAVAGATVVLIKAEDVQASGSVSPLEDLAGGDHPYPSTGSDSDGHYQFTTADFPEGNPAGNRYFIFIRPPAGSGVLQPGGTASRASLSLDGEAAVKQDITITDTTGSDAKSIGTAVCLVCHPEKKRIKNTLHFLGIRRVGPTGTMPNDLMDMGDTSVYDLAANSGKMLEGFTSPATQYSPADDVTKTFWLGRDAGGLYFQLTSDANPKFYLKFTYGGETGHWRGLFMTTVYDDSGSYAADHGPDGNDYAYFVLAPFQYNESAEVVNGETFVTYHADSWDFAGLGNGGYSGDPELESFDLNCAICHGASEVRTINRGLATERRVAVLPLDYDGYTINGTPSQMNIGCEKCHGPGSNHLDAGGMGRMIVSPGKLPPGRLTMICGACHTGGENHTDIGGNAPLLTDGDGRYETFKPGSHPARFFGTSDGTGRNVSPFGTAEVASLTEEGYLVPNNLETDGEASWADVPFGSDVNHSKTSQQQYPDLVRTRKFRNSREILTCVSCHDAHGSPYRHMVSHRADNNAVCLSCHNGIEPGTRFPNITPGMVDRLKTDTTSPADRIVIGADVGAHLFDKTGSLQMSPYDPEGTAMGRCTFCHMPKTARSAAWQEALLTRRGQFQRGDISSHTFDVMATEAVNSMGAEEGAESTTPAGVNHECGDCHRFAGLD